MSNASPLKEPSMDEILASIRRIIESGDERPNPSVRPRAVSESLRARAVAMQVEPASRASGFGASAEAPIADRGSAAGFADDPADEARDEAEDAPLEETLRGTDWPAPLASLSSLSANDRAPQPTRRDVADMAPSRMAESGAAGLSLASSGLGAAPVPVARPHSAGPAEGGPMALEGLRPATGEYPARVEARAVPAARADEPAPYDFNLEFDEESFSSELRDEVVSAFSQAESKAGESAMDALGEAGRLDEPLPGFAGAAPPSVIAETSSLMSEAAGAQVASAFDELARAIREGQMKSMEEMARHMLRPMLQEWLDDNLPRIVERLVREEIERVARGGRR